MAIKTLTLQSGDGTIKVDYKTDLSAETIGAAGNFTVMETVGLSDVEKHDGMDFQSIPHNIGEFKTFAEAHNLKLSVVDINTVEEVIVDYTDSSDSSGSF